ncbi:hypothetical protein L345_14525, partial [Ophiophagus hannah]
MAEGQDLGVPKRECQNETIRVTAAMEDIVCQMGACPKSPVEWSDIQRMERDLLGQTTLPDLLIDPPLTAARESQATILEDEFHDDAQLVQFLSDNLEEEASEWFTQLNDEGAPKLNNVNNFLRELQAHFEDSS